MNDKEREELLRSFEKGRFRKDLPALSEALMRGKLDVAQELINNKANVNEYAKRPAAERGMAPIHFADSPDAIRMLAKAGADVNAPYKDVDHAWGMRGETLLHSLSLTGNSRDLPKIDALLEAGADPSLPFGPEYKYSKDSTTSMPDRLVRADITIPTRLVMLRERKKWDDRDLDDLLSSPSPAPNEVRHPPEQLAQPEIAQLGGKREMNSVERDDPVEQVKHVEPRLGAEASAGSTDKNVDLTKDDSFVSWLNLRMKTAEWDTYERGSEAFLGIDQDLEKLSKANAEMARSLWKENTPPGTRLPFYLTPEFEKAANAQRTAEPGQVPVDEKKAPEGPQKRAGEPEKAEGFKVPDEIKRRYLATENKFFFRDEKNKLAFEDRGRKMVTEHNDPDVAKSLVDLAEAKGWSKIKVAGHDDFKREVWLQATLKGIEVTGYKPKEVDVAKLQELQSARAKNSVERDEGRDVGGQKKGKEKDAATPEEERAYAAPGQDKSANFKGKLLEHGRANYDFDEKKEQSYFVKIETENGTKMHWGVDLGRAMEHAGAKVGEMIELARLGKRPVTVQEKEFDSEGKLIGHKPVETERVEWSVGGMEQAKTATKAADVSVNGSTAKAVDIEKPVAVTKEQKEPPADYFRENAIHGRMEARTQGQAWTVKDIREWVKADAKDFADITDPKFAKQAASTIQLVAKESPAYGKEFATSFPDLALKAGLTPAKSKDAVAEKVPELKGEYKVPVSVFAEVLKEKGYSAKTIERAQAEATKRLGAMAEKGQPAPGVKVFDRQAERERPREKIVSKTKENQQERSR